MDTGTCCPHFFPVDPLRALLSRADMRRSEYGEAHVARCGSRSDLCAGRFEPILEGSVREQHRVQRFCVRQELRGGGRAREIVENRCGVIACELHHSSPRRSSVAEADPFRSGRSRGFVHGRLGCARWHRNQCGLIQSHADNRANHIVHRLTKMKNRKIK